MQADFFSNHNIKYIDYKDTEVLKRFLTPHGRLMARKRTNLTATHQRMLATAVKRARYMGLLPYLVR